MIFFPKLTSKQSVQLDPQCKIAERPVDNEHSGDHFVGLTVTDGAYAVDLQELRTTPTVDATALRCVSRRRPIKELHFVPYYFRANRGGRGHMRVGLRQALPSAGG